MSNVLLRDFLKEGTIIRTKHCDSPNWVSNIIYKIDEDCIEIDVGLEKNYIDNLIMVGDTMKCKYSSQDCEYSFIGWVTRIKADFPQSISIRIHDLQKHQNNRESIRYDVYLCSVIKKDPSDPKGIFTIITNLSLTGCAFVVHEELEKLCPIDNSPIGELMYVEIYVSPNSHIKFKGTIQRNAATEKGIEYGVKIKEISEESENTLKKFISELEIKDKEFYNKRSSFWTKNSKFK